MNPTNKKTTTKKTKPNPTPHHNPTQNAFTKTDLLITLLLATLITLLIISQNNPLTPLKSYSHPAPTTRCISNLKMIGLALRIAQNDNPQPTNPNQPNQPPNQTPNWHNNPNQIWKHYAQLGASNYIHASPKTLICPTDKNRIQPTTWQTNQPPNQPHTIPLNTNQNLSYLLTLNPNHDTAPPNLPLTGDRNIIGPQRPNITQNTILQPPHTNLTYDKNLHKHRGHLTHTDGSVHPYNNQTLPKTLNQLQHPIALPGNHPPTNP